MTGETDTTDVGRSAGDIVEREAGSILARAMGLMELESAALFVAEEFEYDSGEAAAELVRCTQELMDLLSRVSVSEAATLTFWRV